VLVFDTHGANPSLLPSLPFDTVKDLAPVMLIGTSPMVLTAHPASAFKSFDDVITAAKKAAGSVTYGSVGSGSLAHLAMTRIANKLDVNMTHIPYKGGGPLATDAIAGHVPLAIASIALLSPHIGGGALRPLVVTSAQRYPRLPDTPTLSELGMTGVDADSWWGMLAPARTPAEIISRMNEAMAKALREPVVQQGLSEQGVIYRLSTPEAFGTFIEDEIARWAAVIKENKVVASD
jgi:tripartite-type tricarboxylate transporter receptor subunit TctC